MSTLRSAEITQAKVTLFPYLKNNNLFEMASHLPLEIVSHKKQVLSLYKKAVRCVESWYTDRCAYRFQAVLMRDRFEKNRHITDTQKAVALLKDGEEELFQKTHYQPKEFANSIGGNAYGREAHVPDWVLDYWHPLEKAQYPEYFARREQRKAEYIKMWEAEYGKPKPDEH